jgi:hypothetical protein
MNKEQAAETVTAPDSTSAIREASPLSFTFFARCTDLRETFNISATSDCGKASIDALPPVC